jgi:hypothetical protein
LLLFGGLAALSLPLSVLASPRSATPVAMLTREIYPTVTQAMYVGGSFAYAPFPFLLGWYWVGVLLSGLLITAAWYRWRDRRTGRSTPLRGYLVTGLGAGRGDRGAAAAGLGHADPRGQPGVLLPAAVLLLSGLGMLLVAGLRELRR